MAFFVFVPAAVTYLAAAEIGAGIASFIGIGAVTSVTATAIGAATIGATFSALKGDKPEDILKNAVLGGVTSYVGGTIGQQVSKTVSANVAQNLISSGVSQTTANAMATVLGNASSAALTSGTSALLQGKNPIDAMLKTGLTATLSGGVGLAVNKVTSGIPGFSDLSSTASGAALSRATSSAIATSVLGGDASQAFGSSLIDSFIKTVGPDVKNSLKDVGGALKDSASKVSAAQDEINNNIIRQQSIAKDYENTISPLQKEQDATQAAIDTYNGYKNKYDNYSTVYKRANVDQLDAMGIDVESYFERGKPSPAVYVDSNGNRAPSKTSLLNLANAAAEKANAAIETFNKDYEVAKPTLDKLNADFTSAKATYDTLKSDLDKTYQPALDTALNNFNKTEYENTALISEKLQSYKAANDKYKELYGREPTAEDMGKVIKSDTTDYVKAIQDQYNTEKAATDKAAAEQTAREQKALEDARAAEKAIADKTAADKVATDKATSAGFPDAATYQQFGGNLDAYKASVWKPTDTTMAGGEQTAALANNQVTAINAGGGRGNVNPPTRYVPIQNVDADNKNVISASDALSAIVGRNGVPEGADISPVYVQSENDVDSEGNETGELAFTYYTQVTMTDADGNQTGYRIVFDAETGETRYLYSYMDEQTPVTVASANPPSFNSTTGAFYAGDGSEVMPEPVTPEPVDVENPINFDNTSTVLAINENGTALVQDNTTGSQSIVQTIGEPEVGSEVDIKVSSATGEATAVAKIEQPAFELPPIAPPVAPPVVTPPVVEPVTETPIPELAQPPVITPPEVVPPVVAPPDEVIPPVVEPVVTPPVAPSVVTPEVVPPVTPPIENPPVIPPVVTPPVEPPVVQPPVVPPVTPPVVTPPVVTPPVTPPVVAPPVAPATSGVTIDAVTKAINDSIAGIKFPAGITPADVAEQIKSAMEANPNLKIADVTKAITDYMSANPALTAADVNTAITGATKNLATQGQLDAAIKNLSADQKTQFDNLTKAQQDEVAARVKQGDVIQDAIIGATKNLATQSQLDDAVKNLSADQKTQFDNLTKAQQDEVAARVKQNESIQNAIASAQQTTSNQVQNIQSELNGRIDALVKQGVETNAAIQQAIAESQTQINRNDANINSRIDVLVGQGFDYQKATQIAFEETRGTISDVGKQLADKIKADEADKQAAAEAKRVADAAAEEEKRVAAAAALAKDIAAKQAAAKASTAAQQKAAGQGALSLLQPAATSASELAAVAGPLTASYLTAKEDPNKFESPLEKFLKTQNQALGKENQYGIQPQGNAMNDPSYSYGTQRPIGDILGMGSAQSTQAGQAPDSSIPSYPTAVNYAQGGGTRHGKYAQGGLSTPLMASGGKMRVDFRHGDAVTGAGDGQSDDIPAMLADGEFVFPADVVAAIGNGSTKAGSDKLYDMMHGIRAHARSAKPKDLPPQIKSPLDFLKRS